MAVSPSEIIDWKKRLENVENELHLNKPYFKSVYEKKKTKISAMAFSPSGIH